MAEVRPLPEVWRPWRYPRSNMRGTMHLAMDAMTGDRSLTRALRAALFAAVSVVLAATGHAMTSGHDIPLPALLAAFGATGAAAWLGGAEARGPLPIAGALLAGQAVLHWFFSGAGGAGHGATGTAGAGHLAGAAGGPMPDGAAGPATASLAMLAAHAVAALCCACWLWRGEAAFFRLLRCVAALALTPLLRALAARSGPPSVPAAVRPPLPAPAADVPPPGPPPSYVLSRRGPPPAAVPRTTTPTARSTAVPAAA
ncbi:hypothetical protein [Streptomyces zingiberis]|uniref:Integral membrane protein n=1 Tax=Streptomyces zingiberis TaxID=2053010 RepID=A0ABX1BPQ3_9ACTN|nr:hypothetical protein [Streptomyces zingiberis]NJP99701.1 hypothetical protein [Streptomyces zingiberis]